MVDDTTCDNMKCTQLIHGLNRLDNQQICRKLGESIDCVADFLDNCQALTEEMKETVRNDVLRMRQDHSDICPVTTEEEEGGRTIPDQSGICDNTKCAEIIYGMNWFDQKQMCSKFRETLDCVANFAENCPDLTEAIRTSVREDNVLMKEQFKEMCPDIAVAMKPQIRVLITLTILQILFLKLY
ncbi:hypothetical protein LOTGIDRAFT_231744 [Lottia gigantea]|uniref:Uncharacterized protein n=1 Tax=Lottia gigantea TaxID=225164 RepID=V4ATD5_LOTGI|nr:hypothetical protein LOTGIDRAFT_231744 [Lottia gigantea]ESO96986.1 hypothetical protein LOTGIDRAFT_231744 [Lottia gigantea]